MLCLQPQTLQPQAAAGGGELQAKIFQAASSLLYLLFVLVISLASEMSSELLLFLSWLPSCCLSAGCEARG